VAPTQQVVVLGEDPDALSTARWGLIPSWAKDPKIGHSLINARAETVAAIIVDGNVDRRARVSALETFVAFAVALWSL
jgi:hypothetical protein